MKLFEQFIDNPVKVSVGVLIVALFGSISMVTMPKQLIPAVQNPVLSVETQWPGASPQEIEREIVQEQEEQLAAVEGLIKMTSQCRDSSASHHTRVCGGHQHRRRDDAQSTRDCNRFANTRSMPKSRSSKLRMSLIGPSRDSL